MGVLSGTSLSVLLLALISFTSTHIAVEPVNFTPLASLHRLAATLNADVKKGNEDDDVIDVYITSLSPFLLYFPCIHLLLSLIIHGGQDDRGSDTSGLRALSHIVCVCVCICVHFNDCMNM